MNTNFDEPLLEEQSTEIFRNFYNQEKPHRVHLCQKLEQYVNVCDKYIGDFLGTPANHITLHRKLIESYYKIPLTTSFFAILIPEIINKLANTATMNLAETGTVDEKMEPTKTLISATLTPPL